MLQIIKQDIFKFFFMYAGQGSKIAVFTFFVTFIIGSYYIKQHGSTLGKYILFFIKSVEMAFLSLYVYIVIGITFLSREKHSDTYINLRPFSTFDKTLVYPKYIFENILMLIPLAILLYLLAAPFRKLSISLLVGFFSSLAIEIMQLITRLGLFIVDDILTNILGMLIGYLICRMAEWLYKSCYIILEGKEKT